MPDYNLLGSQEVLDELQNGRTRELLLLLQDRPIPEVVDPMNLQSGLSNNYITDSDNDYILSYYGSVNDMPDDDSSYLASSLNGIGKYGIEINPNTSLDGIKCTVSSNTSNISNLYLSDASANVITSKSASSGDTVEFNETLSAGANYYLTVDNNGNDFTVGYESVGSFPFTSTDIDVTNSTSDGGSSTTQSYRYTITSVTAINASLSGYVTDNFTAPTDFKAWNALRAEDVTTGGSTSANPVEFEILDSSDTVLTSARIPASEIADSAFRLRDRECSKNAGSDGQADYTIPQTGAGGHYGLPILSVVTVEQNGNVLDPSNWEWDGEDTVTIDTSTVTIASGDTITISYDFDVFDSTLQPRAYLSRESTSETSPSISHFRYEYIV